MIKVPNWWSLSGISMTRHLVFLILFLMPAAFLTGCSGGTSNTVNTPAVAAPTASNGSVTTNANTAVSGTLSASGPSGATLTFGIVSQPANGSVALTNASTGAFTYTPTSGFSGTDSFTFDASDSGGTSNTATETITVSTGINLTVSVTGLPSGTMGSVTVTGPGGYSQTIGQTTTLQNLIAGTYDVSAAIIASTPDAAYLPTVTNSTVTVGPGGIDAGTDSVSYSSLSTQWQAVGPSGIEFDFNSSTYYSGSGKMQAFAVDNGDPSIMYAGGGIGPGNSGPFSGAGVYKTTNGGTSWTAVDSGLSDPSVDSLWLDQGNPDVILAGTLLGIFQSTNAGQTWAEVSPTSYGEVSAFKQIGSVVYAPTQAGIAESTDDGSSWTLVENTSSPVRAIGGVGGVLYAGLDNGQVLVQTGSSAAWTNVTPSGLSGTTVWHIAVNPTNPANAIVVEWHGYSSPNLYETTDTGGQWSTMSGPGCPVQYIVFEPTDPANLYAGCDGVLYQSTDSGSSWSLPPGDLGWDVRLIVADEAGVTGNLLVGSDQGLFLRAAGSTTWQSLTGSLNSSSLLYGLVINGPTILTTVQDYSPISTFNGGQTWVAGGGSSTTNVASGEAGTVIMNPANPDEIYLFTTGGFQYSTDGGLSFTQDPSIEFAAGNFNQGNAQTMAVDPENPSTVYVAAANGVFMSTDGGASWNAETSWPMPHPWMVAVDPAASTTIFVGNQSPPGLYVTQNGGQTWAQASFASGFCGAPDALTVNPSDPQIILVGMSQSPACNGGIWESTDGGASFTAANSGIENIPECCENDVAHIRYDPYDSGIVGAATTQGLYLSSDDGAQWTDIRGTAVPNAFTDLIWTKNSLYAATFGQGIVKIPFP